MTIFWILAAGLALLAALFMAAPLIAGRRDHTAAADTDQAQINLELFKSQLAELDTDLAAGKLDRTQYEAARRDLEREFLRDSADLGPEDPKPVAHVKLPGPALTAAALVLAVPVSALVLYLLIGQRDIIPQLELAAAGGGQAAQQHAGADGTPPLGVLVQRLEERLQQAPEDGEGWTMLGRTYFAMGRTQDAEQAFARAHELLPGDTQVTLAYAESIAANNDRNLLGKPAELISEVVAAEPDNATARWLAGMVAFQRGQFQSAATAWKRVLDQVDPQSQDADELRQLISQAEQRAGVPPEMQLAANTDGGTSAAAGDQPQAATEPDTAQPQAESQAAAAAAPGAAPGSASQQTAEPDAGAAPEQLAQVQPPAGGESAAAAGEPSAAAAVQSEAAAGLEVSVSLAPELAGRMPPTTTVFVFARAAAGPPMPLALQQLTLADLPATVRLDDSMAMMPQMRLSAFPQVVVGARASASGQAMPQPGDLEGATGPVSSSDAGAVSVTIDRVRR